VQRDGRVFQNAVPKKGSAHFLPVKHRCKTLFHQTTPLAHSFILRQSCLLVLSLSLSLWIALIRTCSSSRITFDSLIEQSDNERVGYQHRGTILDTTIDPDHGVP
jgi:hypothetical protein